MQLIRSLATAFYKPILERWLLAERMYRHGKTKVSVPPQVFHPGFFSSTKLLLRYLRNIDLKNKHLLELGAGTGLIAVKAAQGGAMVTATDINPAAVATIRKNAMANDVTVTVIESDLFAQLPRQVFDFIIINPPYYFRSPANWKEHAWYCGENGEYFSGLFSGLSNYINHDSVILMVLCEGDHRQRIEQLANSEGFGFECVKKATNLLETNFIYRIHQQSPLS